jgi:hypothetical protein
LINGDLLVEIPYGLGVAIRWLGYLLILFALVDFGLSFAGIDITGVRWSPLVAGGIGGLFTRMTGDDGDE